MENNKHTQGQWEIYDDNGKLAIANERRLIATLSQITINVKDEFIYTDEDKANAEFICEAVNNYNKLKEEKEYAEAEGKRLSEVAIHWQKECDKLKEDNKRLSEALKTISSVIQEWNKEGKYTNLIEHANQATKKSESK